MTKLDIVILIVFVASVVWGFRKGIAVQLGAFAGLLLGVLLCHLFGDYVACRIAGESAPSYVDSVIANIVLFIIGFLSATAVAHFFKSALRSLQLGGLDRIGGAIFCCFEWMLVLSVLLNVWLMVKPSTSLRALSNLGNGHAIEAITALAPNLLGWAMNG